MKDKVFKGSIIILTILLFLISVTAVASADNNSDVSIMSLSKGGITLQYPSDWGDSQATSNYSVLAISKINSVDGLGIGQININIEKKPIEGDFETFVNETYDKMKRDSSYHLVSSGSVYVADKEGLEYIYTSTENTGEKEHKAIWFEKGGQAYVIMYSAPVSDFEDNLYVFDFVLANMQVN
jgi:hypothetical protein